MIDNPLIDAARGRELGDPIPLVQQRSRLYRTGRIDRYVEHRIEADPATEPVVCLSCGGTFTRSEDGSIPCGH